MNYGPSLDDAEKRESLMETKPKKNEHGFAVPPRTVAIWREIAKDGYPSKEEYGPYPIVMVGMQCDGQPTFGIQVRPAMLWYFGNDQSRPYWTGVEKSSGPIENSSWHVTHWAPYINGPDSAS